MGKMMVNLRKKKQLPWLGWTTYLVPGFSAMIVLVIVIAGIGLIIEGFKETPLTMIIFCVIIALIIPLGYFVVHVLGINEEE
jgi:hypothetical protein